MDGIEMIKRAREHHISGSANALGLNETTPGAA
jgi:hypothetical protein